MFWGIYEFLYIDSLIICHYFFLVSLPFLVVSRKLLKVMDSHISCKRNNKSYGKKRSFMVFLCRCVGRQELNISQLSSVSTFRCSFLVLLIMEEIWFLTGSGKRFLIFISVNVYICSNSDGNVCVVVWWRGKIIFYSNYSRLNLNWLYMESLGWIKQFQVVNNYSYDSSELTK